MRSFSERFAPIGVYCFSVCVTALYFYPFLHNFFAFDDFRYIENLFQGPLKIALGYNALRVVSNAVWAPLYLVSGFDPMGYTIFSCLLFSLNPLLLFLLLREITDRNDVAALSAMVFAATGVTADAVFWKMSMSTLLQCSFYLISMLLYARSVRQRRRSLYLLALVVFFVAVFTKEDAGSFPLLAVLVELLFLRGNVPVEYRKIALRLAPFAAVIVFYLLTSYSVFHLLNIPSETAKFFKIRPLYSLFGGYSLFTLSPQGILSPTSPVIYVVASLLGIGLFLVRENRKFFLFGLLWVVAAFLPASFSSIGQFQPKYIFNSVSRLLYLPSAGGAMVIAAALAEVRSRFSYRTFVVVAAIFLVTFITVNRGMVNARGIQWRDQAGPALVFLTELHRIFPQFPKQSHVYVVNPPAGRAYVQQSMRAFYRNPEITWIVEPRSFQPPPGETAYIIECTWAGPGEVSISLYDFQGGNLLASSAGG